MNPDAVGSTIARQEVTWTSGDCLLYALAVGAGAADPTGGELAFTTENSARTPQLALPTFPLVVGDASIGVLAAAGEFDPTAIVHGEQAIELHAPLPVGGRALLTRTITGVYDMGSGALVTTESSAVDFESSSPLWTGRSGSFIRGAGGFGGTRHAAALQLVPTRRADRTIRYATRTDQALLYRLCGDRHPLHSDPVFARRAGFDRPILHGLCTFGFVARALMHTLCGSDPKRFISMSARFSSPVYPGDSLTVSVWEESVGQAAFQTSTSAGVVLDRGHLSYRVP